MQGGGVHLRCPCAVVPRHHSMGIGRKKGLRNGSRMVHDSRPCLRPREPLQQLRLQQLSDLNGSNDWGREWLTRLGSTINDLVQFTKRTVLPANQPLAEIVPFT